MGIIVCTEGRWIVELHMTQHCSGEAEHQEQIGVHHVDSSEYRILNC